MRYLYIILFGILIAGCNNGPEKIVDTPTSGKKSAMADEAFKTIIDSETAMFHVHYPDAVIIPKYNTEAAVLSALLNDSIEAAIITRPLTDAEKKSFYTKKIDPVQFPIAIDAIAFIVNPNNPDTILHYDDIQNMMTGYIKSWENLSAGAGTFKHSMEIVLDNRNSGIVRYMIDSVNKGKPLPANASALHNNDEVIDYVSKNKYALGIINVSRVSNATDSLQFTSMKKIRVCYVSNPADKNLYQPIPGWVALKKYPFTRKVYYINCEPYNGVLTGFGAFMGSDIGQLIIQRAQMAPGNASMIVREVSVSKTF